MEKNWENLLSALRFFLKRSMWLSHEYQFPEGVDLNPVFNRGISLNLTPLLRLGRREVNSWLLTA